MKQDEKLLTKKLVNKNLLDVSLCKQDKVGQAEIDPYLSLYRLTLQNTYTNGQKSATYSYDAVLRKWLDAVVMILIADIDGIPSICLRASIRPPLLLREQCRTPLPEKKPMHYIWELPAGLLEDTDVGEDGILQRAHIEILEETGYFVPKEKITRMKCAPFISPGVIPERLWYAVAHIDHPHVRQNPQGDGSPVEENADIEWVGLESALAMCEDGTLDDMKTELGIRRIVSYLNRDGVKNE